MQLPSQDPVRKSVRLDDDKNYVIGRDPVWLELRDASVSKEHAKMSVDGMNIRIEDMGSKNGMFVNGTKVQSSPLKAGDKVSLGEVVIKILLVTTNSGDPKDG